MKHFLRALRLVTVLVALIFLLSANLPGSFLGIPLSVQIEVWRWADLVPVLIVACLVCHVPVARGTETGQWLVITVAPLLFFSGYALNSDFLFRTRHIDLNTEFANVDDLSEFDPLLADLELVVLPLETQVVAFPTTPLNPEILRFKSNDKEFTYIYCGLSHLGLVIGSSGSVQPPQLSILSQEANNMIVRNRDTGGLVRQIEMDQFLSDSQLRMQPSIRMRYSNFKEAFPHGKVLLQRQRQGSMPEPGALVRVLLVWLSRERLMLNEDPESDEFAFPVTLDDTRLHAKVPVYGINLGGEHVAYTKKFLMEQGGRVNTRVGNRQIALVHHRRFDTVAAYYAAPSDLNIDIYGRSAASAFKRVESLKSEVPWGIWQHFFDSDLNRI